MRKTNLTGVVKFVMLMTPAPVKDSVSYLSCKAKLKPKRGHGF